MKQLTTLFCLFISLFAMAQTTTDVAIDTDTTIYVAAEEAPRFPGCEQLDTTEQVKNECAQASLLQFVYSNVQYPYVARMEGIEGTAVVNFVIEKDGTVSGLNVLRDIGGGCGPEVMRVIGAMNQVGIRWKPGITKGKPVRTQFNLPVKFKLEEAPDYMMLGRDSVYTVFDDTLTYIGGEKALVTYLENNLAYPSGYQDSCFIGDMEVNLLVKADGNVKVLEVSDYNNLGFDFQFEAITLSNSTAKQWQPAKLRGRAVPTIATFRVEFRPKEANCHAAVKQFQRANELALEGSDLYNKGEIEAGIAKLSQAIELSPNNADLLYLRGQAYLNQSLYEEACADFTAVRNILTKTPIDSLLPVICSQKNAEKN